MKHILSITKKFLGFFKKIFIFLRSLSFSNPGVSKNVIGYLLCTYLLNNLVIDEPIPSLAFLSFNNKFIKVLFPPPGLPMTNILNVASCYLLLQAFHL